MRRTQRPVVAWVCTNFRVVIPIPRQFENNPDEVLQVFLEELDRLHKAHQITHDDMGPLLWEQKTTRIWDPDKQKLVTFKCWVVESTIKRTVHEDEVPNMRFMNCDPRTGYWGFNQANAKVRELVGNSIPRDGLKVCMLSAPYQVRNLAYERNTD